MSNKVIVALDFDSREKAISLVEALGPATTFYKVGLQMLVEEGPEIVGTLVDMNKDVFLDLKVHEIPNSVAGAVTAAGKLGVSMVTVHASGGAAVLRSAVTAAAPFPQLKVLALTVITSLSDSDLPSIGLAPSVAQQVTRLAQLAAAEKCHGVVASVQEAKLLCELLPKGMAIVTPGIHLSGMASNDQSRTASPLDAFNAGATHVVVGRAITRAKDPRSAFEQASSAFSRGVV
jgi:orotidine-5'-phosphate decarboxylase